MEPIQARPRDYAAHPSRHGRRKCHRAVRAVTGIVNLTQQGDLVGNVQAQDVLLQATGNIGSGGQAFALALGNGGEAFNIAAGGNMNLVAGFSNQATFDNVQAGGTLAVQATDALGQDGVGASFGQVSAGGNLAITAGPELDADR